MTPRQCPFCELRFASNPELEGHLADEHSRHIRLPDHPAVAVEHHRADAQHQLHTHHVPRSWDEARELSIEFDALLTRYGGDYVKALEAQLRGEHVDRPSERGGGTETAR
jgi:hypothetical protein